MQAACVLTTALRRANNLAMVTVQTLDGYLGKHIHDVCGNGYVNEFPLGRLWRDARLYTIGAGTSEIRRMLIGRELYEETEPREPA